MAQIATRISEVLAESEAAVAEEWLRELKSGGLHRNDLMTETELAQQTREIVGLLHLALQSGSPEKMDGVEWDNVRSALERISRGRVRQGFTPSQVAHFLLLLKKPFFSRLSAAHGSDAAALIADTTLTTLVIDTLALGMVESYQRAREDVILRQQHEMLELSTPVVKLWDGVLALPLIGTLDSQRTQVIMESLLQKIVETGSQIAIIDITGVPTVDTLVAQHLMKTVAAARLMGADCIISGIRPQIAQTIVHLGVDLNDVITKASLASAFQVALQRSGLTVTRQTKTSGRPVPPSANY